MPSISQPCNPCFPVESVKNWKGPALSFLFQTLGRELLVPFFNITWWVYFSPYYGLDYLTQFLGVFGILVGGYNFIVFFWLALSA